LKADIVARRATFKENLKKIKDEKKRVIVEKLDTRFNEVNAKRTSEMGRHLDKLTEILAKVSGDVAGASSAIQTARDANTLQAARTYTITITSEANLKTNVGKVRNQLEFDLKAVNELVILARKAVQSLLK
jgi:phosphatidate phosphatase PAH1